MTTSTALEAFLAIRSQLSSVLVSDSEQEAAANLLTRLPALGGAQYLECRVGPQNPRVDFLVAITKFERENPSLAATAQLPGCSGLVGLLPQWTRPGALLHEVVPVTWLEFDDVLQQTRPAASVCVSVVPSYVDIHAPLVSQPPSDLVASLRQAILVIRGRACSAAEEEALERCVAKMPAAAHWIHLSVMTAREPVALKLYGVFRQDDLLGYLESVGWRGDLERVRSALATYCPTSRTAGVVYVDLPLSELLRDEQPSLGICFSQQQVIASSEADPSRRALLAQLVAEGLCQPDQAEALAAWPGTQHVDHLTQVVRWVDIKLVLGTAREVLPKAYLGFSLVRSRPGFTLGLRQNPGPVQSGGLLSAP